MAKAINFDTGRTQYVFNGSVEVSFNPTDAGFVQRVWDMFSELEAKQDEYQRRVGEIGDDGAAMFAYATERDADMRGLIDNVLGKGKADELFPDMNCYALADGMPVWANLMLAIADEIDAAFTDEQKKSDPRIRAYNKKYEGMRKKYRRK